MDAVQQIKNIDELLKKYIGNDLKIVEVVETSLLPPGENYGSILLKVDVTVKGKTGHEEKLHAVAKILPESQVMRKLFNVEETVKKEIAFYTVIVPKLQNFQKQSGVKDVISCFPEYYGGRLNLNGGKEVDEDSVLVLENLIEAGFKTVDRRLGYDLEEAKLVLEALASFHAVPLAMKLKKPMEFKRHIKSYCADSRVEIPEDMQGDLNTILEILYENDSCLPYISKIKQKLDKQKQKPPGGPKMEPREPFATLTHSDMWINNSMIRYEKDVPVEAKIYDLQMYFYDNPFPDLLKFIITSVQMETLKDHLDELLKHYHNNFVGHLQKLNVDIDEFNWTEFMKEFKLISKETVLDNLEFLMYVVYGEKSSKNHGGPNVFVTSKDIPLKAKNKIWFVVKEWGRRDWL